MPEIARTMCYNMQENYLQLHAVRWPWNSLPGLPGLPSELELVAATAARTPTSTRAGGRDDMS